MTAPGVLTLVLAERGAATLHAATHPPGSDRFPIPCESFRPLRYIDVPPGEPAATLRRWDALWAVLNDPDGPELDLESFSTLHVLFKRLQSFGVDFTPTFEARMKRVAWFAMREEQDGVGEVEVDADE